jgi:hypothetical protein
MEPNRSRYAWPMAQSSSFDCVEEWLAQLDLLPLIIAEEERERRDREEKQTLSTRHYSLDNKHSQTEGKELPVTPVRSRETSLSLDEVSPTNTSFSYDTIFDSPRPKDTGSRDFDDVSDTSATTIEEGEPDWSSCEKPVREVAKEEEEDIVTPSEALSTNYAGSLNSISPPSSTLSTAVPLPEDLLSSPVHDPSKPRLVWITSCLQCTLARLPCSRKHPSCSRCKRKGEGDVCLLRRRKLGEERVRGNLKGNQISVLLRVNGSEDDMDEGVWERKVKLAKELEQEWRDKEERKNWVLPTSGGKGNYWTHGHSNRAQPRWMDPGEGIGQQTFAEVVLG